MNLTELLTDKYQVLPADIERAKKLSKALWWSNRSDTGKYW
jgi:hypothetical protein